MMEPRSQSILALKAMGTLAVVICLTSLSVKADDYFLKIIEPSPPMSSNANTDVKLNQKRIECKSVLTVKKMVRIVQVANYSVDKAGNRNDKSRGMRIELKSIDEYENYVKPILSRIMHDWSKDHGFSNQQIDAIVKLNQSLEPIRTKFLALHSADNEKFSGLRIYDSSPRMKIQGWEWDAPIHAKDTLEISERVFPGFKLNEFFARNGIKREKYTWSLGLLDVSGKQEKALLTLMAQAADLLDMNYNNRDFYSLGERAIIQNEDVDIVFYANPKLTKFYERVFRISPVRHSDGNLLALSPQKASGSEQTFYLFHLKGSEFIQKFFRLDLHEPLFSSNLALRKQQEVHAYFQSKMIEYTKKLNPADYKPKDFGDFFAKWVTIYDRNPSSEDSLFRMWSKIYLLRQHTPPELLKDWNNPKWINNIGELAYRIVPTPQQLDGPDPRLLSMATVLSFYEIYSFDPMAMIVNNAHKK